MAPKPETMAGKRLTNVPRFFFEQKTGANTGQPFEKSARQIGSFP